jgi:microcystin-dependent protein
MTTPYLAEIKIFTFGFAPKGWALCNGQLLPINQNQALFSLLGTTYGGDGRVNFGLPNLQGRAPMHMGNGHTLGELGGEQDHTVAISELPSHVHALNATTNATTGTQFALNNLLGPASIYSDDDDSVTSLLPASLANVGGSQPHENRQPYLTLSCCIALTGIFPSQN